MKRYIAVIENFNSNRRRSINSSWHFMIVYAVRFMQYTISNSYCSINTIFVFSLKKKIFFEYVSHVLSKFAKGYLW